MKQLRKYQIKAVTKFNNWYSSKENLATIILPTGTGKTFTATQCINEIYSQSKLKILWAAHREELVDQAKKELELNIPGADIQIEMAENRASTNADIIVGSVQTLHRDRKNMIGFIPNLIVIDEYHHYHENNKQYHSLLEKYPEAKVLGLTATPYRFSGGDIPLGNKLIEMDIGAAIEAEYLVKPKAEALKSDVSLAHVGTLGGDFKINELAAAVNTDNRNKLIVKRLTKAVKEEKRQGLLYAVDVNHSKTMAALLRAEGLRVAEIYGETDKEERRELIRKIRNKEIDVVANNLTMTEGTDLPHLSFVCVARPTKSLGLYLQMIGRGLRLSDGKEDCLIIDVHDTVKVTQNRITYQKVANTIIADDVVKRTAAIMKEPVAEKISHFPVTMKLDKSSIWTFDDDTWFSPGWLLDHNQWVITWSKRQERKKVDGFEFVPMRKPSPWQLKTKPPTVFHDKHGEGIAYDIIYGSEDDYIAVMFGEAEGTVNIRLSELKVKQDKFETKNLDNIIKRAFYIITNDTKTKCRVLSLLRENNDFVVQNDTMGDQATANELIKSMAADDDMTQIVRSEAPWRSRPASDKQKGLIKNMINWGKLNNDIDVDSLTGGNASALMDQVDWKPVINKLFGASKKKDLIGYSNEFEEV